MSASQGNARCAWAPTTTEHRAAGAKESVHFLLSTPFFTYLFLFARLFKVWSFDPFARMLTVVLLQTRFDLQMDDVTEQPIHLNFTPSKQLILFMLRCVTKAIY